MWKAARWPMSQLSSKRNGPQGRFLRLGRNQMSRLSPRSTERRIQKLQADQPHFEPWEGGESNHPSKRF